MVSQCCIMGGSRGVDRGPDPLKNHKNIGFPSNIDPDPLKPQSYQANIQLWAIIGTPARWRTDDGPL